MKACFFATAAADLQVQFALFDKDGDGMITSAEMIEVMTSMGVDTSLQEVQLMLHKVDLDGECWL